MPLSLKPYMRQAYCRIYGFFNDCTALYVYAHAATGTISGTRNQDEYTGRELHEDVVDEKI